MLLAPHILVGAVIAASTPNPLLGLLFAFLSHFLLDRIPHWEYSIEPLKQIKTKGIKYCLPIIRRVALDAGLGFIVLILALSVSKNNSSFAIYVLGGFFGALPDGLSFLMFLAKKNGFASKILNLFSVVHQSVHFSKEKGLPPMRVGLSTQAIAILLALYFIVF